METNRIPMSRQAALKELEEFRSRIDAVDRSILLLLNERTKVVEEIGRVKQRAELPIYEPRREDQVFDNVVRHNTGPLTEQSVRRIPKIDFVARHVGPLDAQSTSKITAETRSDCLGKYQPDDGRRRT